MQVVERTAMRVVVEHRAPGLAIVTASLGGLGVIAAGGRFAMTGEWLLLVAAGAALVFFFAGLWLSHGLRVTLDASNNTALWERTGFLGSHKEAALCDVRGLVMLPASDEGAPTFDPVLSVGDMRWPLSLTAIVDAGDAPNAVADVLDLAKGRRSY